MKEKVFDYALKAFLFLGAIFYVGIKGPISVDEAMAFGYMVQEKFFLFGSLALFALSFTIKPRRSLLLYSLPGFCLFILLTSILYGFGVDLQRKTMNIFIALMLYKTIYENFDFLKIKSYVWWFGWLLIINLAMCVLQFNGRDPLFSSTSPVVLVGLWDKLVGFMRLKAHLGLLAAMFSVLIAVYSPIFLLAVLSLLWFGKVSASILAVVIGFSFYGWFRLKKWQFFTIMGALLGVGSLYVLFYDMPNGQFGERFKIWNAALGHVLKVNPVIGEGIGSFAKAKFLTTQPTVPDLKWWQWLHNDLLQGFFETGMAGMAFIFSFFVARYKDFQKLAKDNLMVALFSTSMILVIIAFFNFPLHLGRFAHLYVFFFAITHARLETLKRESLL